METATSTTQAELPQAQPGKSLIIIQVHKLKTMTLNGIKTFEL